MTPGDHYDIYYADKLWGLLPEVYRSEDSASFDKKGPLRELIDRLGAQAAVVRRSMDRLWEDAYIETCDDWLIPYLADLLATNLVASLDSRGQRLDVAKTIYYRRRKGTVPVLEEIANDITGWEAKVVEFFRLLGRTRHGLDPVIGLPGPLQSAAGLAGPNTRTPLGGTAGLRSAYGASRAGTAFDEFAHTADLRPGRGALGWHNIPRLGVFVWRLKSYCVDQTTPVPVTGCPNWYTFDPTGRDLPLFASASRKEARSFGDRWAPPEEWQMPTPIDATLWAAYADRLYPADELAARSIGIYAPTLVDPAQVTVLPARGRFKTAKASPLGLYCYGFSADVGAGPYDRRQYGAVARPAPVLPPISGGGLITTPAAGTLDITDSRTYAASSIAGVTQLTLTAANEQRPVIRMVPGTVWRLEGLPGAELSLSGLLLSGFDVVLAGEFASVTIRSTTLDPGSAADPPGIFQTSADGRPLVPSRLIIEGQVRSLTVDRSITGPIRTRGHGVVQSLNISDSIVQGIRPAAFGAFAADQIFDPLHLAIILQAAATPLTKRLFDLLPAGAQNDLTAWDPQDPAPPTIAPALLATLNGIVAGPSFFDPALFAGVRLSPEVTLLRDSNPSGAALAKLNRLLLEEAFPYALAPAAVAQPAGETTLQRTTVLGRLYLHRLSASESVLDDLARVEDTQHGCVRFSAWSAGSVLPRQYESVRIAPQAPLFVKRLFGHPGYGQLLDSAGGAIREGAQNGSEMGVFSMEKNAIKERSLLIKFDEYMPIGLSPVVVHVT